MPSFSALLTFRAALLSGQQICGLSAHGAHILPPWAAIGLHFLAGNGKIPEITIVVPLSRSDNELSSSSERANCSPKLRNFDYTPIGFICKYVTRSPSLSPQNPPPASNLPLLLKQSINTSECVGGHLAVASPICLMPNA